VKNLPAIFGAFCRTEFGIMVQYRIEIALWALWGVAYPAVAIAVWGAAANAGTNAGSIKGFGPQEFAAYFLLTMFVGHWVTAWDLYEMGGMVRSGAMSPKLMRPVLPVWENLAANVAFKVLTLAILLPLWGLIALLTHPAADMTAAGVLLGLFALILGAAINFLWGYTLGLTAFWFTRTDAISELWFGASLFFGGRMAPLTLLPATLQWIAEFLPFKWIVWFPTAVLMGSVRGGDIAVGLLMQFAWLVGGLLLFPVLWRKALRQYTAVGA